ncbi:DNA-deoxyinosine glycosylase [Bacteroides sp. GM023]|uniref:DNA-deoxyinosine glycosylase n=1 Tax=Bacteroides sp. GM023 TaxID=2723058 RepID=UPI00168B40E6|nr:DNA-deoxyinosine glycosylase [Bacteroides sp. GM023]MBD3592297.1 DNA-deoxyinosine glycosylase [Bacteroides sp. GM023]
MGKNEFTNEEIKQLEKLIRLRVASDRKNQKRIRKDMRTIGFYGSDYGITNMTIDKFHALIDQGRIKVISDFPATKQIKPKTISTKQEKITITSYCTSMKPVIFPDSEILILGTMPGKTSLESQEYYAASNNCFWKIIEKLYNNGNRLTDYNEKTSCLKQNKIALWDVYEACARNGSLDRNIGKIQLNDIDKLLSDYKKIRKVIFNGQKAASEYTPKIPYEILCSTSNSNTHNTLEEKISFWRNALIL